MTKFYFRLPFWLLFSLWFLHRRRPNVEASPNWDLLAVQAAGLAMSLPLPANRLERWLNVKVIAYLNRYAKEAALAGECRVIATGYFPGAVKPEPGISLHLE